MATISRLKPGQVVYSLERQRMGNTTMTIKVCYSIQITEIDPDQKWVMASWNSNPPRRFYERSVRKWKIKKPEPKGTIMGGIAYY
jgi:hypothetical protein